MKRSSIAFVLSLVCCSFTQAHDTWVQTGSPLVRTDDVVHVDFMLGNQGNEHRDYKLASKLSSLEGAKLDVIAPSGKSTDLRTGLADLGYAPKEGFYSSRFIVAEEGLHTVVHTLDKLHGTTRAVKSAKSYFLSAKTLDKPGTAGQEYAKPLGHPLELVLESHPVLNAGPGKKVEVKLLHNGKPLADSRISFIPRGVPLAEGFDKEYERNTDAQGRASFTPREGNFYLIVAHHSSPDQKGEGYDKTSYSAVLVLNIPQVCPCCSE